MNQEVNFHVGVVLPAAGSGERLGSTTPKQYFEIQGKPLLLYAIEQFEDIPWVSRIIVAADDVSRMQSILTQRNKVSEKIVITRGGDTRHRSIQAGLSALQARDDPDVRVVVVHDAVRPLVPFSLLEQLVLSANQVGAAGPTRPLISTVVAADNKGFLAETLDRSKYLNSETPQAFKTSVLVQAYQKITSEELERGTECLQLVLRHCNVRAKLIPGPEELWKVTLQRDLHSAIGCITAAKNQVCIKNFNQSEDVKSTIESLIESLRCKVSIINQINESYSACMNGHAQQMYNNVIIFDDHLKKKQNVPLTSLIDIQKPGIIIHIITQSENKRKDKQELFKFGSQIINEYECFNKGVVVIYWNKITENQKIINMISGIILNDNAFSGQILFT